MRSDSTFDLSRLLPPALLWVASAAAVWSLVSVPLGDPDLWWNLAAGRVMALSHAVLRTDIFSHTLAGSPWINFEWLSQVALYDVYNVAGLGGLFAAKVAACLAVVAAAIVALRRAGARGAALLFLSWISFWCLRPRLMERAELATLFALPLLLVALLRVRARGSAGPKALLALGAGAAAWANSHGGFVYGLALAGALSIGAAWNGERPAALALARATAAFFVGTLINPFGPKLYALFLGILGPQKGLTLIDEWAPTTVRALPVFWLVYLAAAVLLAVSLLRRGKEARFWTPAIVLFLVWGSVHYRNAAVACAVVLPAVAALGRELLSDRVAAAAEGWTWAFCFAPLFAALLHLNRFVPRSWILWNRFPANACRFAATNGIDGPLFNSYEFGGYIEWALGSSDPVFMDGRYLFQPLIVEQAGLNARAASGDSDGGWGAYLDRYGVDHAIVAYPSFFFSGADGARVSPCEVMFPPDRWALVYWDDTALVFVRRLPRYKAVIEAWDYRALLPYNPERMAALIKSGAIGREKAGLELSRQRRQAGDTVTGQALSALVARLPGAGGKSR